MCIGIFTHHATSVKRTKPQRCVLDKRGIKLISGTDNELIIIGILESRGWNVEIGWKSLYPTYLRQQIRAC